MTLKNFVFIVFFIASISFFVFSAKRLISFLLLGQKENRFERIGERLKKVFTVAIAQTKILREPAGILHVLIFWGFLLFLFAVLESILQGFYSPINFEWLGYFYSILTFTQDVFGALVIWAVIFSLGRRFILRVPRLMVDKHGMRDAAFILTLILFVVLAMFGQNIAHVAKNNFMLASFEVRPFSLPMAKMFYSMDTTSAGNMYEIFWWLHIVFVFGFLNYLPYSKHLHVLTSIPNVFFSKLNDKKGLKKINLEDETLEYYGADDVQKLTWKQLLDGYTCTECGRCTSVCPAANSGKTLSPRKIVTDIRKRTFDKAPLMIAGQTEGEVFDNTLVHHYITDKELWQCTTCGACVQECPVMIEHVDAIVEMRRHLVLTESEFPAELNNVFKSLESNGTPWVFNQADRALWTEGLNIKSMAEDPAGDILFWVGCAGSFDARYKKVSVAFARLMQKAGVNFRILGIEEKCNGDTARRLGNEYLAQQLVQENVETLNGYGVKKIVTACPHCFNSLKNEFNQFGGNFEVVHHTEMISEFLSSGKIQLKDATTKTRKVTYHDSCYLGRYNGVYEEPRTSLAKINGLELVEMKRNKSRGFCCGAGGGRMFLEDVEGGRINEERTREAIATDVDTIASACPFCMTMLTDGVKAHDKTEEVQVKDIAEIVLENSK
ncbi:MAG: Fe-S oxidoreductase [Ignavibacteria bacterium CG_4_10_14_3_um_filter_37_18]|nr:MAG: Fe-S oxidoreductase [Ignavibacteria bacterium CG_4_10_14_3_um_filter_37_18]